MTEINRRFLLNALKLFDLGLVFLAFGIATFLVESAGKNVPLAQVLSMRVKLSNFAHNFCDRKSRRICAHFT